MVIRHLITIDFSWCLITIDFSWCLITIDFSWCLITIDFSWCLITIDFSWCLITIDSGMIEKIKIKFFSSFKGCENVKITMNEEKNNVDGDETSAKVNGTATTGTRYM
jgi:hypothetical protein